MNKAISDLVELSQYAAKHPEFVQGGGGNCSVKYSGQMAIKASGYFLEDISLNAGFVLLDLQSKTPFQNQQLKPSLETNIHYLLGTYVIHTHPILVGAMVCAKEGKKLYKEIFNQKNYYWIHYANPGEQLSKKISHLLISKSVDINTSFVLFLENHGLFISSPTKEMCINLHETVINKLETFFKYKEYNLNQKLTNTLQGKYLTPDHVVYFNINPDDLKEKGRIAINEITVFVEKVILLIKSKNMESKYISEEDCNFIMNMKEEKYRQKI